MKFDKLLKERRNVKKFKDKKPDWRKIIEAINAARFAPMAGGIYTPRFILVSDFQKIQKITSFTQQPFVGQAHYVVVVVSETRRTLNSYGMQGKIYLRQQAGAAIQNFLLKLAEKGLYTCWIWHFVESMVKECLTLPEDIQIEAIFPIGHEFKRSPSTTYPVILESILYFDKYKNKNMCYIKKTDV